MSMEHKCYCRGDEVDSMDLVQPKHLMPMMRPFSLRFPFFIYYKNNSIVQ